MKYKIIQIERAEVIPAIVDDKCVLALRYGFILSKVWTKPIFEIRNIIGDDDYHVFFYIECVEDDSKKGGDE